MKLSDQHEPIVSEFKSATAAIVRNLDAMDIGKAITIQIEAGDTPQLVSRIYHAMRYLPLKKFTTMTIRAGAHQVTRTK